MTTTLFTRYIRFFFSVAEKTSVNATSSFINKTLVRLKSTVSLSKKELRALTSLPSDLDSAIIGMLLGDAGCYRTKGDTSNSRLEFSFGKDRLEFANWIYGLLSDYVTNPVKAILVAAVPNGPKDHTSYRLKTMALPVFNYYRDLFYVRKPGATRCIKIVPGNIAELLTPIVLAHFIMGDGNFRIDTRTIRIFTNGFTARAPLGPDDVALLASAIHIKFGIDVAVKHDRNNQYILVIKAKDLKKVQELVRPHMHESMLYRIGL